MADRPHEPIGRQCWCEPRLTEYPGNRMMVVHDDVTWTGRWWTEEYEDGDVIVRPAEDESNG